ncbi:hypothetical protein JCM13210_06830 [Thermaerobacter litoralis]
MALVGKPVPVETDASGRPCRFFWRRWHRVKDVLDEWREAGAWWDGEGERLVVRLLTDDGAVFELERLAGSDRWVLYKVYD